MSISSDSPRELENCRRQKSLLDRIRVQSIGVKNPSGSSSRQKKNIAKLVTARREAENCFERCGFHVGLSRLFLSASK